MANKLYDAAREAFLKGDLDWINDDIRVVLLDIEVSGYLYEVDTANDEVLADIPAQARVATATLSSKTATAGVADAADVTFSSVSNGGDPCQALVIYKHTGNENTATLLAYIDTGASLPVTPNGEDIVIEWSGGYNRIFRL